MCQLVAFLSLFSMRQQHIFVIKLQIISSENIYEMGPIGCFQVSSISQVNRLAQHEKTQNLLKCKTIRNLFVLIRCGISSDNEGDTLVISLSPVAPQKRFHKPFTLRNPFSLQNCGISIANGDFTMLYFIYYHRTGDTTV